MTRLRLQSVITFAFVTTIGSVAQADLIYSTVGAGDSFGGVPGWTVSATDSGLSTKIDHAMLFTPTGAIGTTHQLDSIDVGFSLIAGADDLTLHLVEDDGGLPGNVIESFSLSGFPPAGVLSLTSVSSTLNPTLTAGTPYWLVGETTGSESNFTWQGTSVAGTRAFRFNDGTWLKGAITNTGAFRLNSFSAVPEPSSFGLLSLAAIGLAFRRRRNSR